MPRRIPVLIAAMALLLSLCALTPLNDTAGTNDMSSATAAPPLLGTRTPEVPSTGKSGLPGRAADATKGKSHKKHTKNHKRKHHKKKHKRHKTKHHKHKHHKKKHKKGARPVLAHAAPIRTPALPPDRSWLRLSQSAQWNPCATIDYKFNPAGAPAGALKDIQSAFGQAHAAGGLNFHYAGTTPKVPFGKDNASDPNTIIIAWSTYTRVPSLSGAMAVGGPITSKGGFYTSGGVVLNATANSWLASGFGNDLTRGVVLLHEIGHVLGLNHVNNKAQVMYPEFGPWSRGRYGLGDTDGLRALGLPAVSDAAAALCPQG